MNYLKNDGGTTSYLHAKGKLWSLPYIIDLYLKYKTIKLLEELTKANLWISEFF
jgi:hypothetical protein